MKYARFRILVGSILCWMIASQVGADVCKPDPCVDDPTMILGKREADALLSAPTISEKPAESMLLTNKWFNVPNGAWTVSKSLREEIRDGLVSFVDSRARAEHANLHAWPSYSFQVQGQTHEGRRVVFINAFCTKPPKDALQQFVLVRDGGACYFQVYYDPDHKQFVDLTFNGIG